MGLRDDIAPHLELMLGEDGLGEPIMLDGVACTGLYHQTGGADGSMDGYYAEQRHYSISATDIDRPVIGQQLDIDGELWTVERSDLLNGIVEFDVVRNMA